MNFDDQKGSADFLVRNAPCGIEIPHSPELARMVAYASFSCMALITASVRELTCNLA